MLPDPRPLAVSVPAVRVRGLVVRYGDRTAVDGLTFDAEQGRVTALVGPNGAGKTSTVECCVGLRRAEAGTVEVLGVAVPAGARDRAALHAQVGVMLQEGGLYPSARPLQLVRYIASLYPSPRDPAVLLDRLGIDPSTNTPIRRLSGGEQRRVAAAAALVGRPRLAFLDEPTTGLDAQGRRGFHDMIRALVDEGTTIVLTTHLMDDVERLADHVVVVAAGRAVADGTVRELAGDDENVAFRGPVGLDLADLRSTLPDGSAVAEGPDGHYRVTGAADPLVVSAVAAWCAQQGIRTSDLSVGRRSLEDVIIDLVGDL